MKPKEVLDFAKENDAIMVDPKIMDFPGTSQYFSVPISELEESSFEELLQTRPATEALTIDQSSGRLNYIIPLDIPASQ